MSAGPAVGLMGVGMVVSAIGQIQAGNAEAAAQRRNAAFYREQGRFAEITGKRQMEIQENETKILYGQQLSAFAKNGVDTQNSSSFVANTALQRQKENYAIRQEMDMNVRLANLRADAAEQAANDAKKAGTLGAIGSIFSGGGQMAAAAAK